MNIFRSAGTIWEGRNLYDLYEEAYTPWEWQPRLKAIADDLGLDLFSTPFDHTAVDFLEQMGVPAYKIASFELVDLPLIRAGGPDRQTHHHVHRHGDPGRDRRGGADRPGGRGQGRSPCSSAPAPIRPPRRR